MGKKSKVKPIVLRAFSIARAKANIIARENIEKRLGEKYGDS